MTARIPQTIFIPILRLCHSYIYIIHLCLIVSMSSISYIYVIHMSFIHLRHQYHTYMSFIHICHPRIYVIHIIHLCHSYDLCHSYHTSMSFIHLRHPYHTSMSFIHLHHPYHTSMSFIHLCHPYHTSMSFMKPGCRVPFHERLPVIEHHLILPPFQFPAHCVIHRPATMVSPRSMVSLAARVHAAVVHIPAVRPANISISNNQPAPHLCQDLNKCHTKAALDVTYRRRLLCHGSSSTSVLAFPTRRL